MASSDLVPVTLRSKFRGRNGGETHGFPPKLASELVSSGVGRWYDDDARKKAERAGHVAKAKAASEVETEIAARAEERAAEIVAVEAAAMEERMADIVSANKKGSAAHAKFEAEVAARDEEIAKLRKELKERGEQGRARASSA